MRNKIGKWVFNRYVVTIFVLVFLFWILPARFYGQSLGVLYDILFSVFWRLRPQPPGTFVFQVGILLTWLTVYSIVVALVLGNALRVVMEVGRRSIE